MPLTIADREPPLQSRFEDAIARAPRRSHHSRESIIAEAAEEEDRKPAQRRHSPSVVVVVAIAVRSTIAETAKGEGLDGLNSP